MKSGRDTDSGLSMETVQVGSGDAIRRLPRDGGLGEKWI